MSEYLTSGFVYIFLAILGILVAIIVPIILHELNKTKKMLACMFLPYLSLVDVRKEVADKIKIYYADKLVKNLIMIKAKIKNTGNIPILRSNIVKPLEFDCGGDLSVIDFAVTNKEPKNIDVSLEQSSKDNLLKCYFDLLNPGDEFTVEFVCLGESEELPKVDARIEGIKQIDIEAPIYEKKESNIIFVSKLVALVLSPILIFMSLLFFKLGDAIFGLLYLLTGIGYLVFTFRKRLRQFLHII